MSSRPAEVGSSDIARETGVGAHIVRPSFPSAVSVDRAGAQYPQGVRRIRKRQSRQRLRCVRPYKVNGASGGRKILTDNRQTH